MGRTVFYGLLEEWRDKKITREDAVNKISRRYQKCVSIFEEPGALCDAKNVGS